MVSDQICYYLGSRYYLPELGRFLNADFYADTGTGVNGTNMFAYCNNNPVMMVDPTGESGTLIERFFLMKYFDEKIYEDLNPDDMDKIWNKNKNEYLYYFDIVLKKLPKRFINEYCKQYFHDYRILSISPTIKEHNNYSIELKLEHNSQIFKVIYKNVKSFESELHLDDSLFMFQILQSEILPCDNNISHEFTVSGHSEGYIHIVCKNISFSKLLHSNQAGENGQGL